MLELARLDLASELALPEPPAWLRVDDSEIVRGGVSYTIDTIRSLAIRFRDSLEGRIGLVIGDDLVAGFSSWKAYRELGEESDILLARRPGISQAAFPYRHKLLEGSFIEASSTTVREAILRGDPSWISLVPPSVSRYITHHRLYERRN
jgi:nicotinate-nucleotide adenylyltransferase